MAKAGMRRPDPKQAHGTEGHIGIKKKNNDEKPVPQIQGKAKNGHEKANAINYDGKL